MTTSKVKRRIKHKLSAQKPTVMVGKHGVSQKVLAEIDGRLERAKMVKVKILKTALREDDAKIVANKVAEQTDSALVEVRGHTFMLYRKKKRETRQ